jgi:8-oxo-dGTP diphosphatase
MSIIINSHGHRLDDFIAVSDDIELQAIGNINGGHAIIMHKGKIIVCYNKYRNNWELPGGGKEKDEDLDECIKREVYEEVGQQVDNLIIKGVSSVFIPRMNNSILWAVYYCEIDTISNFVENEEMRKMILWDMKTDIGTVDEVDNKIIQIVINNQ